MYKFMKFFVLVVGLLIVAAFALWALVGVAIGDGYFSEHGKDLLATAGSGLWVAFVGLGIAALYVRNERREARRHALSDSGVAAEALVLAVRATGTTGNFESIVLKLDLEVRPSGGQPFRVRVKEQFAQSAVPMTGDCLQVLYDPSHPQAVMLAKEFDAGVSGGLGPRMLRRAAFDPTAVPEVPHGWEIGIRRTLVVTFGLIGLGAWGLALDAILENPGQTAAKYVALGFAGFGAIFGFTAVGVIIKGVRRMRQARREHRLFIDGRRVAGVLTEVRYDPRIVINDVLTRVHFAVRYPGPDGVDREVRASWLMMMAAVPLPGDRVQVAYDPARPDQPVFNTDWNTFVAGGRRMITEHAGPGVGGTAPGAPIDAGTPSPTRSVTVAGRRWLSRASLVVGIALIVMGILGAAATALHTSRSILVVAGVVVIAVGRPSGGSREANVSAGTGAGQGGQAASLAGLAQLITGVVAGAGSPQQPWGTRGKQAMAEVTDVRQGFGSINTMNVPVTLSLRVTPTDEPPFDGETTLILAVNALPSPGARVRVSYDPGDHSAISVETRPVGGGGLAVVQTSGAEDGVFNMHGSEDQMPTWGES